MPTGARLARTDDVDDIAAITEAAWRERLIPRFENLDPGDPELVFVKFRPLADEG